MAESSELPGLDPVLDVVAEVAEAFVAAGHALYLVGGVVRDLLLGSFAAIDDIDLTTDATPEQTKALVGPLAGAIWTQGERFGTIGATVKGRQIEITTHRAEAYEPVSRKPVVSFGTSIFEDLSRRDFTINAVAISLPDRSLFDPHGGQADLEGLLLRTPLSPEVSFTDDPLRMMRAARFLPRFDLEPEADLQRAASELSSRLQIVSVERVHDELERLLNVEDPRRGLVFLEETGLLVEIFPALAADPGAGARSEAVELAAASRSVIARRAGLLWPLGPGANGAMKRLRYSGEDTARTLKLIEAARVSLEAEVSAEAVRTVIDGIGLDAIDDLVELSGAVRGRRQRGSGGSPDHENAFFDRLAQLSESEDLSDLASPLSGGQIIEGLRLEPGPVVGRAVTFLRKERLRAGPMTQQQAFDALAIWLQQQENKNRSQPGD